MAAKVIITAPVHAFLRETLTEKGFEIIYEPAISYDQLAEIITLATVLVVTTRLKIDAAILDKFDSVSTTEKINKLLNNT